MRMIRHEVIAFAEAMEQQLQANDHKPGWQQDNAAVLLRRLREELAEFEQVLQRPARDVMMNPEEWRRELLREAADVANFAMFITDNMKCLLEEGQ